MSTAGTFLNIAFLLTSLLVALVRQLLQLLAADHADELPGEGDVGALEPEQRELHVDLLHGRPRREHHGRQVD